MSNMKLATALGTKKERQDFPAMLKQYQAEITRALPKHINPDRMARIALTAFRRTPKLAECEPASVFAAVIQASQLGLEPDTLGRSYLIPYGRECQFVPGWKGLVDLVNRAGNANVWTGAVFEGDEFDYAMGDQPFIKHKPAGEDDTDKLTHVYAVGRVKGSEWPVIEVWTAARIRRHRDRFNKVGKRHYSFENFEMYARKVVLLQVIKYMPASAELTAAVELNDTAEVGTQHLNIHDAIAGTWAPVHEDQPDGNHDDPPVVAVTYAQVAELLNRAETDDILDQAADMISMVNDPHQQDELRVLYKQRKALPD